MWSVLYLRLLGQAWISLITLPGSWHYKTGSVCKALSCQAFHHKPVCMCVWYPHHVDEENWGKNRSVAHQANIKGNSWCVSSRYTTVASAACMRQKGSRRSRSRFWRSVGTAARDVCQASSPTASTTSPSGSLITKEKDLWAPARHSRHLREVCMADVGWHGCSAGLEHHAYRKYVQCINWHTITFTTSTVSTTSVTTTT